MYKCMYTHFCLMNSNNYNIQAKNRTLTVPPEAQSVSLPDLDPLSHLYS